MTRPKVLLVDDEDPMLHYWIREFLRAGIGTWTAQTGRDAAEVLVREQGDFDAVICDLHMPDGSGVDLFRFIQHEFPGLENRIVIVNGSETERREMDFLRNTTNPVMHKPFDFDELARLVHDWATRRQPGAVPVRR
jgi:DNA-binding response OmpR family regulator